MDKPISHRGFHNKTSAPENSLAAFELSILNQYPIELDVRLTLDGQVVVFHDEFTGRMTTENLEISQTDYSTLLCLSLDNSTEKIPLLRDVLKKVDGQVGIIIEIKSRHFNGDLEQKVGEICRLYKGPLAVQSFNPYSLIYFKKHFPYLTRGLLSGSFKDSDLTFFQKFLLENLLFLSKVKPSYIGCQSECLDGLAIRLIRAMKSHPILAWTIKDQDGYNQIKELCDNIIFEGFNPKKNL